MDSAFSIILYLLIFGPCWFYAFFFLFERCRSLKCCQPCLNRANSNRGSNSTETTECECGWRLNSSSPGLYLMILYIDRFANWLESKRWDLISVNTGTRVLLIHIKVSSTRNYRLIRSRPVVREYCVFSSRRRISLIEMSTLSLSLAGVGLLLMILLLISMRVRRIRFMKEQQRAMAMAAAASEWQWLSFDVELHSIDKIYGRVLKEHSYISITLMDLDLRFSKI